MKKILSIALALTLCLALCACGSETTTTQTAAPAAEAATETTTEAAPANDGKVYELRYGHAQADGNPIDQAVDEFARLVEEKTNGQIKITVYPANVLGDDLTMTEMVQMGSLDMMFCATSILTNFTSDYLGAYSVPMLFSDYDHCRAVQDSEWGQAQLDGLSTIGLKGFGYLSAGLLHMINNKQPIACAADFEGLTIRCAESPMFMKPLAAWGANPVPMAWSEVPTSLQLGAIDGTMLHPTVIVSAGIADLTSYYSADWAVGNGVFTCFMNQALFDGMSADLQNAIIEAQAEAEDFFWDLFISSEADYIAQMEEKGIVIVHSTQEQIDELQQICKDEVWPELVAEGYCKQEDIDAILALKP